MNNRAWNCAGQSEKIVANAELQAHPDSRVGAGVGGCRRPCLLMGSLYKNWQAVCNSHSY